MDNAKYIVIKNKMFVYQMTHYDQDKNIAYLTLYKNPDDFQTENPFDKIEVGDWQQSSLSS